MAVLLHFKIEVVLRHTLIHGSLGQMAHLIGEDNLVWGSDYPHPDGVWPDSRQIVEETMGGLDPAVLKKIVCDNAVKLYRMGE